MTTHDLHSLFLEHMLDEAAELKTGIHSFSSLPAITSVIHLVEEKVQHDDEAQMDNMWSLLVS